MAANVSFDSPFYPYEKVQTGYNSMLGSEKIPRKLLYYLLDLPDKYGYQPINDNSRPRVRLIKYLWYDGANPLNQPLPTPQQKLSLLFDGDNPVVDTDELKAKHPKGYRLYAMKLWLPSQTTAKTIIKCYPGRINHQDELHSTVGVSFEIWCNTNIEANTKTDDYDRSYNIEQCLMEALHGVNIAGIGVVQVGRYINVDNGSRELYDETGTNVGRRLNISINWCESDEGIVQDYN